MFDGKEGLTMIIGWDWGDFWSGKRRIAGN
jgi:hypothetical protein